MRPATSRCGFTLIEVMIVIGIITLLVGLLIPALTGARRTARQIACASNLRQLQTANTIYADDHDQRLVPGAADFRRNLQRWHGTRSSTADAFHPDRAPLTPYLDAPASSFAVRACESFRSVIRSLDGLDQSSTGAFESSAGGYGYNNAYLGQTRDRSGVLRSDRIGVAIQTPADPSRTVAFTDAAFVSDRAPGGLIEYSFAEPRFVPDQLGRAVAFRFDPSIHFRHSGRAGVAWLDTHVSGMQRTATHSSGIYRTDPGPLGLGWFGDRDDNTLFDHN